MFFYFLDVLNNICSFFFFFSSNNIETAPINIFAFFSTSKKSDFPAYQLPTC